MTKKIEGLGGNQYTIEGSKEVYDFDGFTVISNEDYAKLEKTGLVSDGFIAPMHSDGEKDWEDIANYIVNYSGFDVDEYILENN